MKALLSIGQAAEYLGLSVDTVRELDRSGALKAIRTPGGHRRFKPAILDAYLDAGSKRPAPPTRHSRQVPPPEVEAGSIEQEEWTPVRSVSPSPPPTVSPQVDQLRDQLKQAEAERSERNRLDNLRAYGNALIPWNASPSARSAVLETVASYVTASRFPASLPAWEAHEAIKAKVEAVLEPYKAAEAKGAARKAQKEQAAQRVRALIEHGKSRARTKTLGWGYTAMTEVCEQVREELESDVESDWSERDVDEMVDEILDEWEEESED